jgi:hypothetical protein
MRSYLPNTKTYIADILSTQADCEQAWDGHPRRGDAYRLTFALLLVNDREPLRSRAQTLRSHDKTPTSFMYVR